MTPRGVIIPEEITPMQNVTVTGGKADGRWWLIQLEWGQTVREMDNADGLTAKSCQRSKCEATRRIWSLAFPQTNERHRQQSECKHDRMFTSSCRGDWLTRSR